MILLDCIQSDYDKFLIAKLREVCAAKPEAEAAGLIYSGAHDFVLAHGKFYTGGWTHQYRQGAPRQCFGNAIALAAETGLRYVEGFALSPHKDVILHGWNSTPDGVLVDTTWCNTGLSYFGVEFSVERADDATWNHDAHVIYDEGPHNPLFDRLWSGEDYTIKWPDSDRLAVLRMTDPVQRLAAYKVWAEANPV